MTDQTSARDAAREIARKLLNINGPFIEQAEPIITAALLAHGAAERARAIEEFLYCALYDATMEGPLFRDYNRSSLNRLRKRYENEVRALASAGTTGDAGRGR